MIQFNPLNEDTGKKYKINATNAICRYYKAMGYYAYTDDIDQWIAEACDNKSRELYRKLPINLTLELKNFLIQHYYSIGFNIEIAEEIDESTGEILNYLLHITW